VSLPHAIFLYLIGAALCAGFLLCGTFEPLAGGTSETTNGITALVRDSSGMPLANAVVRLRSARYLTDTSAFIPNSPSAAKVDTITDQNGRFRIESVDTGAYLVEIQDNDESGVLISVQVSRKGMLDCGSISLKPNGRLYGVVDLSTIPKKAAVFIQIYGMERCAKADPSTGSFIVNNLPEGRYAVRIQPSVSSFQPADISNNVVKSGAATGLGIVEFVPYKNWGYSRELRLNTAASGAGVSGTVTGFPVLLRLTSGNFIFNQASAEGRDIRFAKRDGTPLPYEIERWDAGSGKAEVWVGTDTLYGNDSTQSIIMYWGNPSAADESNGGAVFAAESDFAGVWHLHEEAPGRGSAGLYRDATVNGYHGHDNISDTGREGTIGYGKNFDNRAIDSATRQCDKILLPASSNFVNGSATPLTISMWMKTGELKNDLNRLFTVMADSLASAFILGVYKGDSVSLSLYVRGSAEVYAVSSTMTPNTWHHGAVSFGNKRWQLYIDGIPVDSDTMSVHGIGGSLSAVIGGFVECWETEPGFDGAIDEVRFEKSARPGDWIRLCYMNQRIDNKLVSFK
jgi:hypothetical protein